MLQNKTDEHSLRIAIKPLERTDVTQAVVDRLQGLLEHGILKPGSKLPPEPEMSRLLGISRPSLRQAYKAMSILGILRAVPGDGTYISESTSKILSTPLTFLMLMKRINFDEVFEFRMMLEGELARWAATRASDEQILAMNAEIQNMDASLKNDDMDRYLVSEYEFHNCIAKAAHNTLLLEVISIVSGLLWETRKALVNIVPDRNNDLEQHRAILVAISAHDPEAAFSAMRKHLSTALALTKTKDFIQRKNI